MARKGVIEAIAALSDSAARMGGEPRAAQRGLDEMAAMLIAAHVVVAHLSATRLALRAARGGDVDKARAEAQAARVWLAARLAAKTDAEPQGEVGAVSPSALLKNATLALLAAAREYRRASARRLEFSPCAAAARLASVRSPPRR